MSAKTRRDQQAFGSGEWIFREGDPAGFAYVVELGRVEIIRESREQQYLVDTIGPGELFGEMALIGDTPRGASARAAEPTLAIVVGPAAFRKKLERTDPVIRRIMKILIGRLRDQTDARVAGVPPRRIPS